MRFTVTQTGRYWIVTDDQTGAQWPYINADAAQAAAKIANTDATNMRDQTAATPPDATIPPDIHDDPNTILEDVTP